MNKSGISFETAVNRVLDFIGNPYDAWNKGDLLQKSRIQKLVFIANQKDLEPLKCPCLSGVF